MATLNRPLLFNALDLELARALGNMARTVAARRDLGALVLRGAGAVALETECGINEGTFATASAPFGA